MYDSNKTSYCKIRSITLKTGKEQKVYLFQVQSKNVFTDKIL